MIQPTVTLIDAGTGNLQSVHNALEHLGAVVQRVKNPQEMGKAGRIILPGVGAFARFMDGLQQSGLHLRLQEVIRRGDPLLGICVGMQAFFETGLENGLHAGLGWLAGSVERFPEQPGVKVPHTGWNQVHFQTASPLLKNISPGSYVYFNHSYYCAPTAEETNLAKTDYGLSYASIVQKENIFGVQFHPEKSQAIGLRLLENFLKM